MPHLTAATVLRRSKRRLPARVTFGPRRVRCLPDARPLREWLSALRKQGVCGSLARPASFPTGDHCLLRLFQKFQKRSFIIFIANKIRQVTTCWSLTRTRVKR